MAKHRKLSPARKLAARWAVALFLGLSLLGLSVSSANAAVPVHQGFYRHVSGNTYEIDLTGWAPSSEYTLFKRPAGGTTFDEVANSVRDFSGATDFNVGVRAGTVLEIDVWNGRQSTYSFYLTATGAPNAEAALSTHWN